VPRGNGAAARLIQCPEMNAPERIALQDVQSRRDGRNLRIDAVGLEAHPGPLDTPRFERMVVAMLERLGAARGMIEMRFPYFLKKAAPVSGAQSLLDYEACWHDNPKFVEDLLRDVALALDRDPRVGRYSVEAENFESIHNHSAFARISRGQP